MIALDCETEPFGPANMAPPLVVLTVGDERGAALFETPAIAHRALSDETIVGLNIAYDLAVLANEDPELLPLVFKAYDEGRVIDVGIRQQLLDLANGELGWAGGKRCSYSLAELAQRHLGIEMSKDVRTTFRRGVPLTPEQRAYAELDVVATAQIGQLLPPQADETRQFASAWWIHLMHCWGMTTSPEAVAAFARMAQENYDRLSKLLVEAGLKRPDHKKRNGEVVEGSRDTKKAMALLVAAYEAKGVAVPVTGNTPFEQGGRPCLDEESCARSGDPLLRSYADFSSASKVLSNDVGLLTTRKVNKVKVPRALDEPVHARFHVLLETGDIGCSNPNMVNLPTTRGVRECFVPRPEHVFLACDYAAIQLRTWAQCCINLLGYSTMADVLNANECPHTMIAADLLGEPYEVVKSRPKKTFYFQRQCGKVANFGFSGGMGIERLIHAAMNQYGVEIDRRQAQGLRRTWAKRWLEAEPYLEIFKKRCGRGTINIEQYYSGRRRGRLKYTDAANGTFSALSYDAIKDAGLLVSQECYIGKGVLMGSRIVNVIHDELLLEVPEVLGHECAERVSKLMIRAAEKWIPDVPAKVEATLMRRWSKSAEPVWVDGRLVPWDTTATATSA